MPEPKTVLVVDDDREIVTAATLRLRAAGYRTLTAHDGDSGVAMAVQHHPDVIVLDVRMPGKDGLTALRELKLRDDTKDIPVVILSASVVEEQAALAAVARFFLKKPYRGDTLLRAVTMALESPCGPADLHAPVQGALRPDGIDQAATRRRRIGPVRGSDVTELAHAARGITTKGLVTREAGHDSCWRRAASWATATVNPPWSFPCGSI